MNQAGDVKILIDYLSSTRLTHECHCWFLLFWFLCLQAPAWNSITKAFAGNDKVSFGDVNLAEEQIRKGNPGEGGWPTVR